MVYSFAQFELDVARVELRHAGRTVALEPQVFALLAFLVEHRDRLVSRDEIFEKVWDGRIVTDSALTSRIKSARKALGDDGKSQRFIKTIHGQGLRFVADVRIEREDPLVLGADSTEASTAASPSDSGPRPSIAVLPFRIIGDAGAYASIAEGLPHELITELAKLRWLFVIARGSSFRLRDRELDMREVGRLLGVRYGLTGTVEITGRRLSITTDLVDTRGGDVVWGERYAGYVDDVHAVRSEIRSKILSSLEIQIPLHEASDARLTDSDHLDAWSAYHLGLQHVYRFNARDNATAAELFERATALDPGFARAYAGLSFVHFQTAFMRRTDEITAEIALARSCAQRGIDLDPLDPFVNFTMGRSYWLEGDLDTASAWLDRATSLSPNYAQGLYARAWTETMAGKGLDGREHADLAMRLSPLDPLYYAMIATRGLSHLLQGEDADAAAWAERAARSPGAHVLIAMIAAAIQRLAGNDELARSWAANVRERRPEMTREDFFSAFPVKSEVMRSRLSEALKTLGF